jgi:DNA-binding beta-propeller fold protein YncE
MRRLSATLLLLGLAGCCALSLTGAAQEEAKPTGLGGKPFFVKKTWVIGGEGNWDYLTVDPTALQLFVAHGTSVQVVDVSAGALVGQVTGMRDAHGIALDDSGALGFVSDGPSNEVHIFDRRSLQVVASVPTGPNPRAIVYEPLTKLVFAVCTQPIDETFETASGQSSGQAASQSSNQPASQAGRRNTGRTGSGNPANNSIVRSVVTVIDSESHQPLANLLLPGKLGFAQVDGRGEVFVNIVDRNRIAHFDAQAVLSQIPKPAAHAADGQPPAVPVIDWSGAATQSGQPVENRLHSFRLGAACQDPIGLAVDMQRLRLFAACNNQKMEVLNSGTGEVLATLTIGAGTDAIGYDATRGLIYTSNGGGLGSLTVIRQDVTDSYAVIQELPTRQRARTLAVNPVNGEVYLVTNLQGFDLNKKGEGGGAYTLPVVQAAPVSGSFQVLVVGN